MRKRGFMCHRLPRMAGACVIAAILPLSSGVSGPAPPDVENVLVFDANGFLQKSYNSGDFTTLVDPTDIHYEEYDPGSPPTVSGGGTEPYTYSAGEFWVPNQVEGTFPAPAPGLPSASLFSFGSAVLDLSAPGVPGISLTPGGGSYSETLSVEIKAYPPSAVVEVFNEDAAAFETFGNTHTLFLVQSAVLQVRSVDGINTSDVKSVTYTLTQDPTVDTDDDGIPDLIELQIGNVPGGGPRFNPLIPDRNLDTDLDGLPDIDEGLRGSDPDIGDSDGDGWSNDDETSMGADPFDADDSPAGAPPAYAPPLLPDDTDGDGWYDLDEMWRATNITDASDFPTARTLYEVETHTSGLIGVVTETLCAGCIATLNICQLEGFPLAHDILVAIAGTEPVNYAYSNARSPRGFPSLIRFAEEFVEMDAQGIDVVSYESSGRRYLPAVQDVEAGDIDPSAWYTGGKGPTNLVQDWFMAYRDLLAVTLLQTENNVDVTQQSTATMALLDAALGYVNVLPPGSFYIAGRPGYSPPEAAVAAVRERLRNPVQKPNAIDFSQPSERTINELVETLEMLTMQTGMDLLVAQAYQIAGSDGDVEALVAPGVIGQRYDYLAVLALSLSYDQMVASGYDLCRLLDPFEDLDSDNLANYIEAMGFNKGRESSVFHDDTDGDGIDDASDNCPTFFTGPNSDNESDGLGDPCDFDDDNDGLGDELENAWAYTSTSLDTDGDGWADDTEYEMGIDPSDPNDALLLHTTVSVGNTFAAQPYPLTVPATPLVLAGQAGNSSGIPFIPDLQSVSVSGFNLRVDPDPGNPGALGTEPVSYLVLSHTPPGWNTDREVVGADWEEIQFEVPFPVGTTPLLLTTIQTEGDTLTFYPEVMNVSNTGFEVRIRPNAFHTPPASIVERVGWAAFLPEDLPTEGAAGEAMVDGAGSMVLFPNPFVSAPDLLVSVEGSDSNAVVTGLGPNGFNIQLVNDEAVGGTPGVHRVSWLALGEKVCDDPDMDGVCTTEDNSPLVYNPDQVDTDSDGTGNVEDIDADNDGLPDDYEASFDICGLAPFNDDTDGDGIPDGLEDPDNDGFTTVEEFVGGSDPFDPTSVPSEILDANALLMALEDEGISPETLYEFALYWMTTPP